MNPIIKRRLSNYGFACEDLVKEFLNIYYNYGDGWVLDEWWWVGNHAGTVVSCADEQFWNMPDIVTALKYNIPKDILFSWYDEIASGKELDLLSYYRILRKNELLHKP